MSKEMYTLTKDDLFSGATVTPSTTEFVELGKYQIPAGVSMGFGFATALDDHGYRGTAYVDLEDSGGADLHGQVQLSIENPRGKTLAFCGTYNTRNLNTGETTPSERRAFPYNNVRSAYPNYLVVKVKMDAATAITKADSTILIDTTLFDFNQ